MTDDLRNYYINLRTIISNDTFRRIQEREDRNIIAEMDRFLAQQIEERILPRQTSTTTNIASPIAFEWAFEEMRRASNAVNDYIRAYANRQFNWDDFLPKESVACHLSQSDKLKYVISDVAVFTSDRYCSPQILI